MIKNIKKTKKELLNILKEHKKFNNEWENEILLKYYSYKELKEAVKELKAV